MISEFAELWNCMSC